MNIAVIGAGVAGLTTAYLLTEKHKVFVFEKTHRPGGGIFSAKFVENDEETYVDFGFTFYNRKHYPHLVGLLDKLDLRSQDVPKSIAINYMKEGICWHVGENNKWFTSKRAYFRPINYRMSWAWQKLKKDAEEILSRKDFRQPLSEYCKEKAVDPRIQEKFIKPLMQSCWFGLQGNMDEIPAYAFFATLDRLGLLEDDDMSAWRIVRGGAFRIISQIVTALVQPIRFNSEVVCVSRHANYVEITTQKGEKERFDLVIFAIPADDALKVLSPPTESELNILGSIPYQECTVVVHSDERFIQKGSSQPTSWVIQASSDKKIPAITTWDLNYFQRLPIKQKLLLTLNPNISTIPKEKILYTFKRKVPQPTWKMLSVQRRFTEINGMNRTYFCGDFWGLATLEDTLASAMQVVQSINKEAIRWT